MMQEVANKLERVSALVDGQLQGDEFIEALRWAGQTRDGQLTWQAYHVVGDVLRTGETLASDRDAEFMARWQLRLARELSLPKKPEDAKTIALKVFDTGTRGQNDLIFEAANDAAYRWKRLAGLASVLAVAAVGLLASGLWNEQRDAPQLAQVPVEAVRPGVAAPAVVAADVPPIMIRDSELDALLAAHRQFGGTTALQVPTGFLRNATFEGGGR